MEKYNGWSNYFTWLVNLWLVNEYGYCVDDFSAEDAGELAEQLEECVDGLRECDGIPRRGMFCDVIGGALSFVNWFEIAESMLEDSHWK